MKVRCPSFRWHEGRARERQQIVDLFPKNGRSYIEPFAGSGNVFYEVINRRLHFKDYCLNDTQSFLFDVERCKMGQFPVTVSRKSYEEWKKTDTPESRVLARAITYGGKGYFAGFIGVNGYNRDTLLEAVWLARSMLKKAFLKKRDWSEFNYPAFGSFDFIYFDPPSRTDDQGKLAGLIDHEALVRLVRHASFKWVLTHKPSGYYAARLQDYGYTSLGLSLGAWRNFR